jgi:ABC-type uncharacterized transport system involved in gliding motility auxiliary subunit
MTTNKHKWEPLVYSGLGVAGMLVILVAAGIIAGAAKVRLDLTAEKLYTLSDGTKKVLRQLDTPVSVRFYCTQTGTEMPVLLKNYAQRVEDLLAEFRQQSGGRIEIQKFDPQPDSDAEDSARLDGIEGQPLSQGGIINLTGEKVYLGVAVTCLDEKATLPFLSPAREKLLEYDLTRAIANVTKAKMPNLGVMTGLPMFGQMNPMLMRMGQGGQEPWVILNELKRDFNVKQVEMTAEQIDEDIPVLLVVYPANISEKTQYALDQFVLRGGKLIACLDPLSSVDSRSAMGMQNMLQRAAASGATLDKLLKAWGLEFDMNKVVADKNYVTTVVRGNRPSPEPTWLSLTAAAVNQNDEVTKQIDSLLLPFAGVFTGTPAAGLKETVLLKASPNAQLVDKMMAQFGGDPGKDYAPAGKEYTLALRLTGEFKTAFPEGKPAAKDEEKEKEDKAKTEDKGKEKKEESLKSGKGTVVLVGDTDFVFDNYCVQVDPIFGATPRNGNLAFVQNLVEQLMGDSNLIPTRSRAVANRPFERVKAIQAHAELAYQSKIKQLEQDLSDTQQKLNELQRGNTKNQRFILSPEQQAEINKFYQKKKQVSKELKDVRKQLRKDIDALEVRLKWVNIALMPFLVTVAGVTFAAVTGKMTARARGSMLAKMGGTIVAAGVGGYVGRLIGLSFVGGAFIAGFIVGVTLTILKGEKTAAK